jgi:septum site-determining protein MinC
MSKFLGEELAFDEDANAKIVFGTLRSGQRVETPFSLIVVGDVNPGADLIAGGDIIVLGNLRGTAHAAAYDDDGQERVIVALQMQPMQLRIGSVISRGSDEGGQGTEVARIDSRRIIVEAFNPRGSFLRKGR